jgi:hypothetical protein
MRFTLGTMTAHNNSYVRKCESAQGLRKELIDEDVVAALLCSLPESYSTLVNALEGQAADLTVNLHVVSSLTGTVNVLKPAI